MSPASFRARYAAYSLDLLLFAPLALLAGWPALARLHAAIEAFNAAAVQAMEGAFAEGHLTLLALAGALREDAGFAGAVGQAAGDLSSALGQLLFTLFALLALWFIGFEASPWQATPGKRALGLRVIDGAGARASLGRAALRFVGGAPSWLLLHLGHAMVGWRDDGRALHDLIAGTRVVALRPMPAWANAFLALQLGGLLLLLAWVALRVLQAVVVLGL